jgi:3-oxoadipate enol-lactonase
MRVPHAEAGSEARIVETAARGRLVVWETPGPPEAPTLVLLHGVTLDAATNWSGAVATLAQHFRVLALDLRGHGGGPPARVPYRLEDCADDVAAVLQSLDTGPVIVAGYSMGGMVAQAFWRRHPEVTAGLVLCATARNVSGTFLEQLTAMTMPFVVGAVGWIPPVFPLSADLVGSRLLGDSLDPRVRQAVLARMRRMPLVTALAAMQAVCHFSSHRWIGGVDVPSAVLVTRHDRVVPPSRQMRLAQALPGAEVVEVDGDHDVFVSAPGAFAHALTAACLAAASQSRPGGSEQAS